MALISNQGRKSDPIFTDEVTRKKIERHLSDINDKITDQDIENIKTDVTPNSYVTTSTDSTGEALDEKRHSTDGNNSNEVETTWNILD